MIERAGAPAIVELRGVARTYPGSADAGIRNATLTIRAGEFVSIVGPSGSGKSTLLNVLGLLDRPTAGEYLLDGRDVATLTERERDRLRSEHIGFVFQSAFVLGDESALRNAALGLRIRGVPLRARADEASAALELVGIRDRGDTAGRLLSGGERQRVAIARAVATRPRLILADEPTGNLDSSNSRGVMDLLRLLNDGGATIVLITHDAQLAAQADRRIVIVDGRTSDNDCGDAIEVSAHERKDECSRDGDAREHDSAESTAAVARGRAASSRWSGWLDDLGDTVTAMVHRPWRSLLLALAFALGIGGLVAAAGIGETASSQVAERLSRTALDEVRVTPPDGAALLDPDDTRLTDWCAAALRLPHVEECGFSARAGASTADIRRLGPGGDPAVSQPQLIAASPEYLRMEGATCAGADTLSLLGRHGVPNIALVGAATARALGVAEPGPGSTIWIYGRRVDVVGVLRSSERLPRAASTVVVSRDVLAAAPEAEVTMLLRTQPGFPAAVAVALPLQLDPADPGRFSVETVADLRKLRYGVASDLSAWLGVLAGILLVLAAISAATTMQVSVQSRSQEIALRRALGTSRGEIARLFLIEGGLLGVIGAATGTALGALGTIVAAAAQGWGAVLPPESSVVGLALGLVTGVTSAVVPAWAASRREPALAIRG